MFLKSPRRKLLTRLFAMSAALAPTMEVTLNLVVYQVLPVAPDLVVDWVWQRIELK